MYEIDGELREARSCHCSTCRKAFSAQASAYALVDPKEFSWVSGQHLLTTYESKDSEGLQFFAYAALQCVEPSKAKFMELPSAAQMVIQASDWECIHL